MIMTFEKCFTIIICSFYTYGKLLNLKTTSKNKIICLAFAVALSFSIYYLKLYYPLLIVPLMILFSYIFMTIMTKTETGLSITTTIISFGISYAFFAVSTLFVAVIFELIGIDHSDDNAGIFFICIALLQLSLIGIPFRFRRLKSGMPFLRSKGGSNTGIFISVLLLCSVIVISNGKAINIIYLIPIVAIFLSGVLVLFWWRSRLKKVYIEKLRTNEIQRLQNTIKEKNAQIEHLEQHNDFLAKIIHKDNKLIPAMELAVREYLQSLASGNAVETQAKGQLLSEQLKLISCERSGIIDKYQSASKTPPLTNVISVDSLMTYMLNKAGCNGIDFELVVSGSVKYLGQHRANSTGKGR